MNKRIYSVFIIICLCLYAVYPVSANENKVTLKAVDSKGAVGSLVDVGIMIENNRNVFGGSFNIIYDASALEIIDCVKGDIFGSMNPFINKTYANGKVRVVWNAQTPFDEGELLKLSFYAKCEGETKIEFEKVKFGTINAESLQADTVSGTVTISEAKEGLSLEDISITENDGVKDIVAVVKNYSAENEEVMLYVAQYTFNDTLLNVTAEKKTVSPNKTNTLQRELKPLKGCDYAKVFVWNSQMIPITDCIELDV